MDKEMLAQKNIPNTSGVYFFTKGKNILYIGKATSLRDRVRSYFSSDIDQARGPLILKMLEEATDVTYEETDSVLEALLLEARLIKKHQPPYNTREKSDKSFNHIVITREDYPRIFPVRERDLATLYEPEDILYSFGPFPEGSQLKVALKIIRKIFPFRAEKDSALSKKRVSKLNQELGLAPDFRDIDKDSYAKTIRHIKMLFDGKKKALLKDIEKEMKRAAKEKQFEDAETFKRQLFALEHIQDIALIKDSSPAKGLAFRIEAYDVAHTSGKNRVGVMTVVDAGYPQKSDYRKFKISKDAVGDTGALQEVLKRRFTHDEWAMPRMIVVDGSTAQRNAASKVLDEYGYQIPIIAVVKNERHQPKNILGDRNLIRLHERDILIVNAEAHRFAVNYHRSLRGGDVS